MHLGAGRVSVTDKIDLTAGIILNKKVADRVKKDDVLCTVYTNKERVTPILKEITKAFKITSNKVKKSKVVIDYIK